MSDRSAIQGNEISRKLRPFQIPHETGRDQGLAPHLGIQDLVGKYRSCRGRDGKGAPLDQMAVLEHLSIDLGMNQVEAARRLHQQSHPRVR